MPRIPYIPVNPVSLVCPQCGAMAGKACKMLRGELRSIHVEWIAVAAEKDVAARKALSANTHYAKDKKRKLKKLLERISSKRGGCGREVALKRGGPSGLRNIGTVELTGQRAIDARPECRG